MFRISCYELPTEHMLQPAHRMKLLFASRIASSFAEKKGNEVFPPHEWLAVQTTTCSSSVYCSPAHTTALSVFRSNYFVMDARYQLSPRNLRPASAIYAVNTAGADHFDYCMQYELFL